MNGGAAHDDFDFGTGLVEEGSGFESALTGADDGNAFAREKPGVRLSGGVGDQGRRKSGKGRRAMGESGQTSGNDNAASLD